jgi:hypothetical protein
MTLFFSFCHIWNRLHESIIQAPASSQSLGHEHPARLLRTQMGVESVSGRCKQPISWARASSPATAHADGRGVCFRPLQAANLLGTSIQPGFCARRWAWSLSQAAASSQSLGHEHPARLLRTQMGVESVSGRCKQPISWARAPRSARLLRTWSGLGRIWLSLSEFRHTWTADSSSLGPRV